MKKPSKSLFQVAAEKYTSISFELKENKKTFFEQLAATTPMSAADLNKSYTGKDAGKVPPTPAFTDFGASSPGGNEKPTPVVQPAPIATAPGQMAPQAVPGQVAPTAGAPAGPTPQQTALLTDPAAKKTPLPDGRVLIEDPKNPQIYVVQSAEDAKRAGTAIRESVKATIYTVEDIMSALTTLSTGAVSEVSSVNNEEADMSEEGTTKVKPAGDVLVDEEEEGEPSDEGLNTADEADDGPNVDQASELGASGSEIGPKSVTGSTDSVWSGLGGSKSPGVASSETEGDRVVPNNKTGIDPSYTQEDGQENIETEKKDSQTGEEEPVSDPTDMLKGPNKATGMGTKEACGEGEACGEAEVEGETNPSGKESAFWVPNDDMLGLKDIIGSVAKGNGVPDSQETIAKTADGVLVKKPTTPIHTPPNMRQYVRTNPMPGTPGMSNIGMNGQPADISDLDSVMGMDTASDRALNISLNFNF